MPESPSPAVLIAIEWAIADATDRAWATELAVASLGWGTRFGADYLPCFVVADPTDPSLPAGIAMHAVPLAERHRADTAPLVVLLGPVTPATRALATRAAARGVPVLVRTNGGWHHEASIADARRLCADMATIVAAIHDGVPPAAPLDHAVDCEPAGHPTPATREPAVAPRPVRRAATIRTGATARSAPVVPSGGPAAPAAAAVRAHVVAEAPRVAVVIPTYNRAAYLGAAIDSALAQHYPHVEVVVADDGSTDDTAAVARAKEGPRVRYFGKAHTNGPDTRNRVLATIDAPWIVWLGDDDLLTPECIASRVAVQQAHPDADVVYGDLVIVDEQLRPTGGGFANPDWYHRNGELLAALFERNQVTDGGSLIRAECIRRVHGYDPAFPKAHDYEFWARLAPTAVFKHDATRGYLWRWHGTNMGLGSGTNPYADAHIRITLGLVARHDPRELFPTVPWDKLDAATAEGVSALMIAMRLWREDAVDFALQFARTAVERWPVPQTIEVYEKLAARRAVQTAA